MRNGIADHLANGDNDGDDDDGKGRFVGNVDSGGAGDARDGGCEGGGPWR